MTLAHNPIGMRSTLVGRARQLAFLRDCLTQVAGGSGRIVLVSGDAGIGKSRLGAELKTIATQRGMVLLEGRCFEEDQAFPFAPVLDLLRAFSVGRSSDELRRALGPAEAALVALSPQLAVVLPDTVALPRLDRDQEKRRLFDALTLFVLRQGTLRGAAPLLLMVEDLHWCDSLSLEWLLSFARQLERHPVLLLLTVRGDETAYDVDRTLAALGRLPLFSELQLGPWTRADLELLLRSMFQLSDAPHPEFLDALLALTDGNPFFVEEVLKSLIAAGDIYAEAGAWTRKPMRELRIPRSIQIAVRQRVRGLDPAAQRLLMLAAVAGQRFDFAVLQAATQASEAELMAHIKALLAVQLVVEQGDDTFAFRHELTRRAVYAELLAHERKLLHRTIAEALVRCYGETNDAHVGELARHFFQGGVPSRALPYARRAGEQAEGLYAYPEAVRHYSIARDCAVALGQPAVRAAIERAIGEVYFARGQFPEAISFFTPALELTTDPRQATELKVAIGKAYAQVADRRGVAFLQQALGELDPLSDQGAIAAVMLWLGRYSHYLGHYSEARAYLEQARALSEPLGDVPTLRFVYSFLAGADLLSAHFDQGKVWAQRSIALGETHAYLPAIVHGYVYLVEYTEIKARWVELHELVERGCRYARQAASDSHHTWLLFGRAGAAYYRGELHAALEQARECMAKARELDDRRGVVHATKVLVMPATALGEQHEAAIAAEAALAIAEQTADLLMHTYSRMALAWLSMEREDWAAAAAWYTACVDLLAGTENRTVLLELSAPLAEAHAELGNIADAEQRVAWCLSLAQETGARQFEAVAWRVLAKVEALLGRSDVAFAAITTAIELCEALGSHLELARALFARGTLRRRRNELAAAEADWSRARDLCLEMGARPLLWRIHAALAELALRRGHADEARNAIDAARAVVDALAAGLSDPAERARLERRAAELLQPEVQRSGPLVPGGLTRREREVATLIAHGATNRAIAEALVLSERTVATHVSNILSKLDFTSRTQIATWAGTVGLAELDTA